MLNIFSKFIFFICFIVQSAFAQLVPINETELSNMTGQAFINIDQSSANGLDFTKITLGLDVKTLLNSDLLELGKYERSGEDSGSADIRISDFALGEIDSTGNIIPFEVKDPFIELAFEEENGKENLVGVRLGFGGASGKLSGDIQYLTGNINVNIAGTAKPIRDVAGGFNRFLLSLAGISDSTQLSASAELVNQSTGVSDPIRAQYVGIKNGDVLNCNDGCGLGGLSNALLSLFSSNQCAVLGIDTCFPLSAYKSLDIGSGNADASGLFLSFQTKSLTWYDNGQGTQTVEGAFFNIPNGGITVNFEEAFQGTARARTRYADPYFGGF
jgi:hypothetical protein